MKMSSRSACHVILASLVVGMLSIDCALADPSHRPSSKALTFTLSTTTPATPRTDRSYYLPGATKYSAVKLGRTRSHVALESLELAHEGFLETEPGRGPYSKALTVTQSTTTAAPPGTADGKYVIKRMVGRPKGRIDETGNATRSSR